jgi:hypothetical protein
MEVKVPYINKTVNLSARSLTNVKISLQLASKIIVGPRYPEQGILYYSLVK